MVAQRMMITDKKIHTKKAAVREAMLLLAARPSIQQWVCEVCGMVHLGTAPDACDSCGVSGALVQHHEICREMNSHW
jgi:rubrerythrin